MDKIKKIFKNRLLRLIVLVIIAILSYIFYDLEFNVDSILKPQTEENKTNKTETASDILTGRVIKVADGDTFTLETDNGEQVKIRLYAIDAPERGQDYGTKSKNYLNELCYGKTVKVEVQDTDQYGRTLGIVFVDGKNINEELVRNGLAWYYSHFATYPRLDTLEQLARKEKLNIWSMKNPIHPHDFRKGKREKNKK